MGFGLLGSGMLAMTWCGLGTGMLASHCEARADDVPNKQGGLGLNPKK